jgi:hypothetical protein
VLDAHANEALCDGYGVLWDELLEGDKEGGLDGDATGDCGAAGEVRLVWGRWAADGGRRAVIQWGGVVADEVGNNVEQEAEDVGDHGNEEDELDEFMGAPGALEVAAAIEDGRGGDEQTGEILLDDGGQSKDPGIDDGLGGDNGQKGHAVADADQWLLDLFDPARVGAQGEVEEGAGDGGGEQAAGEGRQVEAGHGRGSSWSSWPSWPSSVSMSSVGLVVSWRCRRVGGLLGGGRR